MKDNKNYQRILAIIISSCLLFSCGKDNNTTTKVTNITWTHQEIKSQSSDGIGVAYIAKSKTSMLDLEEEKNLDSQIDLDKDNANK